MNVYSPPSNSQYYNPSDYNQTPDVIITTDNNENHLDVTGDIMEGTLTIQSRIKFNDGTNQYTAFENEHKDVIEKFEITNGEVNTNIIHFNNKGFIGDIGQGLYIKTNDSNPIVLDPGYSNAIELSSNNVYIGRPSTSTIHLNNEQQQNAYTNDDHNYVDSLKDKIEITTDDVSMNKLQTQCVHYGDVGTIGCDTDTFVINAHDNNHITIDSGFAKQITLKSSHINLSRETNPAYIKFHNDMYINSTNRDLIMTTGTGNKTIFQNDIQVDSKITFNDDSEQTKAFTDAKSALISTNEQKLSNWTFNEFDTEFNKSAKLPKIIFPDGSEQSSATHTVHGLLDYIDTSGNILTLKSGTIGDEKLVVNAESITLIDNSNISYGEVGRNNNIQVELKSTNAQGISLNCGSLYAGVNIQGNHLTFDNNSKIVMNGEEQTRCFSENLYQKLVNNPRIMSHSKNLDWGFLNLTSAFSHSQSQETIVKTNIGYKLTTVNFDPAQNYFLTNGNWNMGPMRIQFKYGVNYSLKHCQITRLKSRIIITGASIYTGPWQGTHYKSDHWDSNHHIISYGDSAYYDIQDGDKLFIETDYKLQTSTTASGLFDLDCMIEIVQV